MHVATLFERYYFALVEFSWHIVKCQDTAFDIVQDIFVKLLENPSALPSNEKALKSYLYTAVRNSSLNHLRHQHVKSDYQHRSTFDESDDIDLLNALIYAETISHLHGAINTLPDACQEVCKLTYLEGKSNSEAAALCGVSINTVKTHKRRSIKLLRHRLSPLLNSLKQFVLLFL